MVTKQWFILCLVSAMCLGCSQSDSKAVADKSEDASQAANAAPDASAQADSAKTSSNPYIVWRNTLDLPEGSPTFDHVAASDCENETSDDAIFECADKQFWRIFQRDSKDLKAFWNTMNSLESKLSDEASPVAKALFVFRRAQIAMTYIQEQTDITPENMANVPPDELQMVFSMSSDMETAVSLDPSEPFYLTWLDTVKIAMADRLGQPEQMMAAVDAAWINVEKWNEKTTRSTLVASLTGTASGLSIATGIPHKTVDLLETFACHPKVLMEKPDAICGKGDDRRSCLEWCLANSKKAPFGGPGFMYHIGEAYARIGNADEAQNFYELALTLPGVDVWPYRNKVEEALADMDAHVSIFTNLKDEETGSYVVYANSKYACSFCHGNP